MVFQRWKLLDVFRPNFQRALIFQGGGSLGAYEAGVFQALYENITREYEKKGEEEKGRPLFDIVAGTSIGAICSCLGKLCCRKWNLERINTEA